MRATPTIFTFALAAGLAALTGCSCGYNEPPPPQFMLAFSPDTLTSAGVGFRRVEIRSAYLVRYDDANLQTMLDTLRQPTPATAKSTTALFPVYYMKDQPAQFVVPAFVRQNVNARSFRLVVPLANRSYDITNVVLEQTAGSGRCSAPRVSRKEATVNGQRRDALNQVPQLTK
ncbi:hypothetical protein [Hymenobacter properus]|uniref:Lipoprotein n=1 Tax=Hymenobacter properus TaxID=2791026 RepID=A0A931BQL0_9BACT|nr:hypothetical protein [Hymenobacter properus]MBF9143785.1 hypothetical protein [Hymenobacter properus]MBR7722598.1 hypothetical protein [Microvirga sp. SRT04]